MAPLLEIRHVSKTFPGVRALEDVSMSIERGEAHMLLGQNGAGKSTLIKILCGATDADSGSFAIDGDDIAIGSPADARRLGIAVIFQEFSLVPYLSVAQNIFLGREPRARVPGTIDHRRMNIEARRLLQTLGVEIDPTRQVHALGMAQQQIVEIAKALSQDARILVMDEPTAALSDHDISRLLAMIRMLKERGVAILYVSHRLSEVFAIGDRITVLRDGRKVGLVTPSKTTPADLVRLLAGREVVMTYRTRFCDRPGDTVLEVRDLQAQSGVRAAALHVRAGEIVGLAGLVGSGRTELARAIFGADPISRGAVLVRGQRIGHDPVSSVRAGLGLVPENRKTQGLALIRSVQDNLLAAGLGMLFPDKWYRPDRARAAASTMIDRLRIATPSPRRLVRFLSGGNQQKVVLGKWLETGSRVFIFDEPTRGVDVGARAEIFGIIDSLVAQGAAALMISSELSEIAAVCDRAYVMRDKAIVGELPRHELTEENILRLAMHHA
jgi:ribose transport system ATP-binding protein